MREGYFPTAYVAVIPLALAWCVDTDMALRRISLRRAMSEGGAGVFGKALGRGFGLKLRKAEKLRLCSLVGGLLGRVPANGIFVTTACKARDIKGGEGWG